MLFHTIEFAIFLATLLLVLALVRRDHARKVVLVAFSYFFYMWWNPWFVLPLLATTFIDYFVAMKIEATSIQSRRKSLLVFSLVCNLGLLAWFKYFGFFVDNVSSLARAIGFDVSAGTLSILLPVGISFYTFHSMSYTIDVYRREIAACHSALRFALFITFFPVLVAGPILRARQFLVELEKPIRIAVSPPIVLLALRGLVKKVLIADNLAPVVNAVFRDPQHWPSLLIWIATISFAIQIYCDFSGYSDMARALAALLGYRIPINFNHPYRSLNPAEFWRRWHISLSTWLRDYLYIPLGGSREGTFRTSRNLMITMLLGGLWHGASWNFVLWGALHGIALSLHRAWRAWRGDREGNAITRTASWLAFTWFLLVTWICFRISDFAAMRIALRKFVVFDGRLAITNIGAGNIPLAFSCLVIAGFIAMHVLSWRTGGVHARVSRWPLPGAIAVCAATAILLVIFWPLNETPFIYFQF
jgi:alginate O-acetyltransferase complex protein AlgI